MKRKRQTEILAIISENEVENQEMLKNLLEQRGYHVTQATVSRDMNELGLEKGVSKNGVYCYMRSEHINAKQFESIFQQSVIRIDYAGNMVCVKCRSGLANAACATLDSLNMEGIVGTLSGDDTIFILARTESDAKALSVSLRKMV